MEFFPATLDRQASDELADRIRANLEANTFEFWVVEIPGVTEFAGSLHIGLTKEFSIYRGRMLVAILVSQDSVQV